MRSQNNRIIFHFSIYFMFAIALSATLGGAPVYAGCTVTQDDGEQFTDNSVNSCTDYYPTQHACKTLPRNASNGCARLDMFMAVDWNNADLINNAHRGVWGLEMEENVATNPHARYYPLKLTGAPENSLEGVYDSESAGWRSVEYDFTLASHDISNGGTDSYPVLGHYLDLKGFSTFPYQNISENSLPEKVEDGFVMNTNVYPEILGEGEFGPMLRTREGFRGDYDSPAGPVGLTLSVARAIELFHAVMRPGDGIADMVLVMDPKYAKELKQFRRKSDGKVINKCIGFCGLFPLASNQVEARSLVSQLVVNAASLYDASAQEAALHRTVFKLPQAIFGNVADVKANLGANFSKTLFAPQPDPNGKLENVMPYIDGWIAEGEGKHVAFWDTAIKSPNNWMGKQFEWQGETFADLTDYLKQKSGKRSAIWAQDLSGPAGRHGNYFMSYTNYPGEANDLRGDLFANMYLKYARNVVITTDRPDNFLQLKRLFKKHSYH